MKIPQRRRWLNSSRDFTLKPTISSLLLSHLLLLLVSYGCRKEVSKPEHNTSNIFSTIERDKKWYENYTNGKAQITSIFSPRVTETISEGPSVMSETIVIDWNHATTFVTEEKTIVEAPVNADVKFSIEKARLTM